MPASKLLASNSPTSDYTLYTDKDGNPVTDTYRLQNTDYRIIEVGGNQFTQHEQGTPDPDCPELGSYTREQLENFCLHRENDGHCTELGQPCVLLDQ